jgi:hypothetical protein
MSTSTGRGREERISTGDDLVVRAHVEGHQRHQQRVSAGRHAYRVADADQRGDLALEGVDFVTEDESLAVADADDRGKRLVPELRPLPRQVEQRHGLRRGRVEAGGHVQRLL